MLEDNAVNVLFDGGEIFPAMLDAIRCTRSNEARSGCMRRAISARSRPGRPCSRHVPDVDTAVRAGSRQEGSIDTHVTP
jgi:hypothetical protein